MGRSNRRDREGTPRRRPVTWPRVPRCKARIRPLGVAMAKAGRGWVGRGGVRGKGSRAEARKDQRMRSAVVSPPPPPVRSAHAQSRSGSRLQRGRVLSARPCANASASPFFFLFFPRVLPHVEVALEIALLSSVSPPRPCVTSEVSPTPVPLRPPDSAPSSVSTQRSTARPLLEDSRFCLSHSSLLAKPKPIPTENPEELLSALNRLRFIPNAEAETALVISHP